MDHEKKSVAKIVKEINERVMREQGRDISSPMPFFRKGAVLLRKGEPGAHAGQNTNLAAFPGSHVSANGRKTLFFEKIVDKGDLHEAIYSQDTPESCSNLKAPFNVSGAERHSAENASAKCKQKEGANSTHKNRVTFAENIVTDVFYYEGSAEIDDSELSGEISDTVPQSALNTENGNPGHTKVILNKHREASAKSFLAVAQQGRDHTTRSSADTSKTRDIARTLSQKTLQKGTPSPHQNLADTKVLCSGKGAVCKNCEESLCVQAKKSMKSPVNSSFSNTDEKHRLVEPHADAKMKNIDREVSHKLCPEEARPSYGSPDSIRVREEIEAIKKSLSIKDLIRIFEVKIRENRP